MLTYVYNVLACSTRSSPWRSTCRRLCSYMLRRLWAQVWRSVYHGHLDQRGDLSLFTWTRPHCQISRFWWKPWHVSTVVGQRIVDNGAPMFSPVAFQNDWTADTISCKYLVWLNPDTFFEDVIRSFNKIISSWSRSLTPLCQPSCQTPGMSTVFGVCLSKADQYQIVRRSRCVPCERSRFEREFSQLVLWIS